MTLFCIMMMKLKIGREKNDPRDSDKSILFRKGRKENIIN